VTQVEGLEIFDVGVARAADGALGAFNRAGLLSTSDVHVAARLARIGAVVDDAVVLGAAFAARAPRMGHVCVDLGSIRDTASTDTDTPVDLDALPWPDGSKWVERMAASALVGDGRPLQLDGTSLYLDRLWRDEQRVAADLLARARLPAPDVDPDRLAADVAELFTAEAADLQCIAAATAVLRRLSVVAGGPGTGKTWTIARVLGLLERQAAASGSRPPQIALAAPTGKAAARLEESVRLGVEALPLEVGQREHLGSVAGTTIHRLLGYNPGNPTRFRHDRSNLLPFDVVVVDETSMLSLTLMARLVDAVRPEARLILVGDPEQLASVEAGAVLGDIVGPASKGLCLSREARAAVAATSGRALPVASSEGGGGAAIGDGIVVLDKVHRHEGAIAELAKAIQHGDADAAVEWLASGDNVEWIRYDAAAQTTLEGLAPVRTTAVETGRAVIEAARAGDAPAALAALGSFRILCAHRRGPEGVETWMHLVEGWLQTEVEGFVTGPDWYEGRPVIVTENDYTLQLYNGDTGVVIKGPAGRLVAAFERGTTVSPTRLASVDTVYAMTVHKSQGSEFDQVAFLLPGADSRVLTRELLYTAVTRARKKLTVVGAEERVREAIARPITRASGLGAALWGPER
jgi:exodeoxyribonuclease V alpha subunit